MRATEALALRNKDFDFDDESNHNNNHHQAFVRIRGESTKTRTDRYVFLTKEMIGQCKAWTDYKYRRRRLTKVVNNTPTRSNNVGGKAVSHWIEPELSPDDLFFSMPRKRKRSSLRGLYVHMNEDFAQTLDRKTAYSQQFTEMDAWILPNDLEQSMIVLTSFYDFLSCNFHLSTIIICI